MIMSKVKIVSIVYAIGIIIGALFFDIWGAKINQNGAQNKSKLLQTHGNCQQTPKL